MSFSVANIFHSLRDERENEFFTAKSASALAHVPSVLQTLKINAHQEEHEGQDLLKIRNPQFRIPKITLCSLIDDS
jgi:hypothetical protein